MKKGKYILGIDGGTQSTKVLIFDTKGNVICEATKPLRPLFLAEPVVVLHPEDDLWDSLVDACRQLFQKFEGDPKDILGVGLCTIRCCRALLKADGSLAYPVMSWMDKRLSEPYEEMEDVRYITTSSGYITNRLVGQRKDTCANYEGVWPIDYKTGTWTTDPGAYEKSNMPRDMLFDLVNPGDKLGQITREASEATGIPCGIPVFATANDKAVEMLGAGRPDTDTVLISLGTYITSMVQGDYIESTPSNYWINMASEPGKFLFESYGIRRGMWTLSWARDLMGNDAVESAKREGLSTEDYLNRLASDIPAGCDGLMTIPEFLAPVTDPYKRGVLIGFDGRHSGIHIYRSVQEAIAMTMYNNASAMTKELGIDTKKILVTGGGSKGDLFMQIFADVFGLPARRNESSSVVGLGTAICACVGLGIYQDFSEAISNMVRAKDVFEPDPANHELYTRLNSEVYSHITEYTDEILKNAYKVFHG